MSELTIAFQSELPPLLMNRSGEAQSGDGMPTYGREIPPAVTPPQGRHIGAVVFARRMQAHGVKRLDDAPMHRTALPIEIDGGGFALRADLLEGGRVVVGCD